MAVAAAVMMACLAASAAAQPVPEQEGRQLSVEASNEEALEATLGGGILRVFWTAPAAPEAGGNVTLAIRMEAPLGPGRWVAVGFPVKPATMIGASAAVLRLCPACPQGASLEGYYLGDKNPAAVQPPGRLKLEKMEASSSGGGATATVTVTLPPGSLSGSQLPVIFATGPLDIASQNLRQHTARGAATLDLATAAAAPAGDPPSTRAKVNAHAWLMAVGWTILLAGAVIATSLRSTLGPFWWFQVHRAAQVTGMAAVLTGYVVIFSALGGDRTFYTLHFNLGTAAFALGCAQLTALVARPALDSPWRRAWALGHRWVGRAAVLCAVANIYEGIIGVQASGSWAVITFSVVLGLIIGAGAVKDGVDYLKLPPPALMGVSGARGSSKTGDGAGGGDIRRQQQRC